MERVNVLVVSRAGLHKGYLDDIAAVDQRIYVKDGFQQFVAELQRVGTKSYWVDRLKDEDSGTKDWQTRDALEDLDTLLAQAEVIYGALLFPENLISRAPKLKWIHIGNTGINDFLLQGIFSDNVTITNSRGVVAIPIAEHALAFMIMLSKNATSLINNKQHVQWKRFVTMELRDKTVGIIGLGAIGGEVCRLARGIGMRVFAVEKAAAKHGLGIWGVDELYPTENLRQMLSESDFVVITAPLTAETKGMIGERELKNMKPSAYLVNVARGQIVDQSALVKSLKEGWIAGAALDVFENEPLPSDDELWKLPNVILSPHMAGWSDRRSQRVVGLFCENLRRYLTGKQLLNVIDKEKGF